MCKMLRRFDGVAYLHGVASCTWRQRVEVGHAGLRVLRRDRAAAHIAEQTDESLADLDGPLDPAVLFVRSAAVDLEQHPEAAAVDGDALAGSARQLRERRARN